MRPASGKQPYLWVPGGDIKMTALMETLPAPATAGFTGEDITAEQLNEWGLEDADAGGQGSGRWRSRWAPPRTIYAEEEEGYIPKVIANPPVMAKPQGDGEGGSWVLPFWREAALLPKSRGPLCTPGREEGPGVLVSTDRGKTWEERGGASLRQSRHTHLIEGSVARVDGWNEEGRGMGTGVEGLLMYFRTSTGVAWQSSASAATAADWTRPRPTKAPNPDAKGHLLRLEPDGPLAYAGNRQRAIAGRGSPCRKCRTDLGVSLSWNQGRDWTSDAQSLAERHRNNFEKSHYPTVVQVGCKLVMVYSRGYSCCAPKEAELGVFAATYTIEPWSRDGAGIGQATDAGDDPEEGSGEGEKNGDEERKEDTGVDPEDWDIDPASGRPLEKEEKDVGWDGVTV